MNPIELHADVAGLVCQIPTVAGEKLQAGQPVLILESMKMEIAVESPINAQVERIFVIKGDTVQEGQLLAMLLPD